MVEPFPDARARLGLGWLMAFSALFGLALVLFRHWYSGGDPWYFLVWNLFLAAVPLGVSRFLRRRERRLGAVPLAALVGVWLLFFPNAPYILTDLFHLGRFGGAPLWYDLAVLLTFAWTGLVLGFMSLQDVEAVLARRFGVWAARLAAFAALFLGSFGIYVGRYLRWNSWDLLASPLGLWNDLLPRLLEPLEHPGAWGMTLVFTVFLALCYLTLLGFARSR